MLHNFCYNSKLVNEAIDRRWLKGSLEYYSDLFPPPRCLLCFSFFFPPVDLAVRIMKVTRFAI